MKRTALLLAALVAVSACAEDSDVEDDVVPGTEAAQPQPAPVPSTDDILDADFKAEGGSEVTGEVDILPAADATSSFRVRVNLDKVPAGEHAWHIHNGACGAPDAPVVVPFSSEGDKPGIASNLVAATDGKVTTEVAVPSASLTLESLRSGNYSLHVHQKAGADHGPTNACADLKD
jgi:Cu/Zn superoxide dismutase